MNYFKIELLVLSVIFVFHAALIIIWHETTSWNKWLYLSQYALAVTQLIFFLLALLTIIVLKLFMHIRKLRVTESSREGFAQVTAVD
jgi:hypothetical protein